MEHVNITGKLATGVGEATGFTGLEWVRLAFRTHFGFEPEPGTVNLHIGDGAARASWEKVKGRPSIVLHPPRTDWCDSRLWRATIEGCIPAGIVLPDVAAYPPAQIELVAPVRVREALKLADGDNVTIAIELPRLVP